MDINTIIATQKEDIQKQLNKTELALGEIIFNNGDCQILSQSGNKFELIVDNDHAPPVEYHFEIEDDGHVLVISEKTEGWNRYSYACLLQIENEIHLLDPKVHLEHQKYSRAGMIKRVLKERRVKSEKADYKVEWAGNIHGDHILTNENGIKYKIFLRDFDNETGYSDSMDSRHNKLGTTKHIMYTFQKLKDNKKLQAKLDKTYPFVEIFCDPLNDNRISWYYPHKLPVEAQLLISRFFKKSKFINDDQLTGFLDFLQEAGDIKTICIRPEVVEKIQSAFEDHMLEQLSQSEVPDYSLINADLYDYQKEGIEFSLFKKASIIADEMGLGKTIQAISIAILKKKIFGFKKTMVVCPASLKEQWKKEIEKFSKEKALIIQDSPEERAIQYKDDNHYFVIVNYETILRDHRVINHAGIDFLILDEAQRIKNYETKTASAIKQLDAKHKLVITGTPIENKLIDIFSIAGFLDPYFLGPLWEFSYQHCLFDPGKPNKINGYYNLDQLNKKLGKILIRREKRKVIEQLPNIQQINIPVNLSPLQADYHGSYARGIAKIIRKKFLTPFDLQRLQVLLSNMRMVCDSTYLIDEETNESPKLDELKYMLFEKLDIANTKGKLIIFSEWIKVHKLIGKMLRDNYVGFVELNGKIPVKLRGELIRKFENNEHVKVFLSTEAGGTGLNLQVADTLINFELPWNPAKKNQRIGRIDRLGQKSNKLTVFNFITRNSIEQQIAAGLLVKQNLFDGVLGDDAQTNFVDFSSKGRSQFIQQLEEFIANNEDQGTREIDPIVAKELSPQTEAPLIETPQSSDVIDLSGDAQEKETEIQPTSTPSETPKTNAEELEKVMDNGMEFLSGILKMATGKDLGMENKKIEINKETGEVTMKFKLPI